MDKKKNQEILKQQFSINLNRLIDQSGLKKSEVAEHIGVSKSTLTHYTTGVTIPRNPDLQKLAEYFGVSIDSLLKGESLSFEQADIKRRYDVPVFYPDALLCPENVYDPCNFFGIVSFPTPISNGESCYGVYVTDDLFTESGIREKNYVFFSTAQMEIPDNSLAAVLIGEKEKCVAIRRVCFEKENIILKTDKTEITYSALEFEKKVRILGKVIM